MISLNFIWILNIVLPLRGRGAVLRTNTKHRMMTPGLKYSTISSAQWSLIVCSAVCSRCCKHDLALQCVTRGRYLKGSKVQFKRFFSRDFNDTDLISPLFLLDIVILWKLTAPVNSSRHQQSAARHGHCDLAEERAGQCRLLPCGHDEWWSRKAGVVLRCAC